MLRYLVEVSVHEAEPLPLTHPIARPLITPTASQAGSQPASQVSTPLRRNIPVSRPYLYNQALAHLKPEIGNISTQEDLDDFILRHPRTSLPQTDSYVSPLSFSILLSSCLLTVAEFFRSI